MRKRIAVIITFILIFALGFLGYYLKKGREILLTDPYKAISSSACIVIEAIDIQDFINEIATTKGLLGEVARINELNLFQKKVRFLADQFNTPAYKKIIGARAGIISFHLSAGGKLEPLLSMAPAAGLKNKHLRVMLGESGIKTISERAIDGNRIIELPFAIDNSKDTVYISVVSGLLLCTPSLKVMLGAILQTGRVDDIRNMPGFSKVLQAAGKNEDKVFVVFRNLPALFRKIFRDEFRYMADRVGQLAGCAGEDIYIGENGLAFSGYTECQQKDFLARYKSATPALFHTFKILPSGTVFFKTAIVNGSLPAKTSGATGAGMLAEKLEPFLGNEITRVLIDIKESPASENMLVIYELKNSDHVEKIFLDESIRQKVKEKKRVFKPDEQTSIPVYHTPYPGFCPAIYPGFSGDENYDWFAFYDNFLVTGNSFKTISKLLYDNILNKTLANDLIYRDFESSLPSIGNFSYYCVPSGVIDYFSGCLKEDLVKILRSNKSFLDKIQAFGFRFVPSNNMIYNSISLKYKDEARQESTTEWETLLDTVAATKPFFFTNHVTGAKEIFIEDMKNNAYLVNAAGRVLWKVPLTERINGTVYMIDYFKNGKYQLLFAGKNYIHLLDRNGNYVERFPVKLRSPATNPLAMFDYDNNLNYRLLVAGEDKLIYSYDKSGSLVKGWKPFRTKGTVRSEINWFRVSGKDYLVVSDAASIYFLDRSGNRRLTPAEPVTRTVNSSLKLIPGSIPCLVCTDPGGVIQKIYFDGKVEKTTIKSFSTEHSFDIFDVNGDGFGEYIFIDKGILYLYNSRIKLFEKQFGSGELSGPLSFVFSATDRKIGVFDMSKSLIYLVDKNGETMNGFPLRGASVFSIGKLSGNSNWHLIVGGTDNFLYNYKLDTKIK